MSAPDPLTPAGCDLRGLPYMPLDVVRLIDSDLTAISTGEQFKAAVLLYCKAWNQVPAASLPSDDRILAHLVGLTAPAWRRVRDVALRGWVLCSDGRLYHPVIAEKAVYAWSERQDHRAARENETERKRRERDERRRMFADLRAAGVHLPWDVALHNLRLRHAEVASGAELSAACPADCPAPVTAKKGEGRESEGTMQDIHASAEPPRLAEASAKTKGFAADQTFAEAWGACTDVMRRRSNSREKTLAAWKRAAATAGGGQVLVEALRRYLREDPDVQRTGGPGFHRWLGDGTWEHWLPTAAITDGGALPDDRWRIAVRLFQAGDDWPDTYGPAPGKPGCLVPIRLLHDA